MGEASQFGRFENNPRPSVWDRWGLVRSGRKPSSVRTVAGPDRSSLWSSRCQLLRAAYPRLPWPEGHLGVGHTSSLTWPCSDWGLPCRRPLLVARWALTPPFHPYPQTSEGGSFSVALSVASRRPGVTWQSTRWSSDFPRDGLTRPATITPDLTRECNYPPVFRAMLASWARPLAPPAQFSGFPGALGDPQPDTQRLPLGDDLAVQALALEGRSSNDKFVMTGKSKGCISMMPRGDWPLRWLMLG